MPSYLIFVLFTMSLALLNTPVMYADVWDLNDPQKKELVQHLTKLPNELQNEVLKYLFPPIKEKLLASMRGKVPDKLLQGHEGRITSLKFIPDSKMLASGSLDGTIRLWDVQNGGEKKRLTHGSRVESIAVSPDGKMLVSTGDMETKLWNIASGEVEKTLKRAYSVAFSPDGNTLGLGSWNGVIRLMHVKSGEEKKQRRHGNRDDRVFVTFSLDGNTLVSRKRYGPIMLWDTESGKEKRS